jgi:hypothetical protein
MNRIKENITNLTEIDFIYILCVKGVKLKNNKKLLQIYIK